MGKVKSQSELYSIENIRIGVLGGTFDPPHLAHIHMAESAFSELNLDCVAFMPLGVAPHGKKGVTEAKHRINMLEIILEDYDDFFIDDYETKILTPSYTIDSAKRINAILGENSEVYFVIGADSLMYLDKWRDTEDLLKIAKFAVIPRHGYEKDECILKIKSLEEKFGADIVLIKAKKMDNSSTDIRSDLGEAEELTHKRVLKYINDNKLYR